MSLVEQGIQGFRAAYQMAWLDCIPQKLHSHKARGRSIAERFTWGVGSIGGGVAAVGVILGRVIVNSWKTGTHVFMDMVNAVLQDEDRIESWGLAEKEVHAGVVGAEDTAKKRAYMIQTYWLGGLGGILGLILGFIVGTIGVGFCYHTWLNGKHAFLWGFDPIEEDLFGKDDRSLLQKGVGILGTLLGGALGLLSWMLTRVFS